MNINEMIETASGALASKPLIGGSTTIVVPAIGFIDLVTPYLEIISICLGITIGLLTVYGMLEKRFSK